MSVRAMEDDEERRWEGQANAAAAATLTQATATAVGKGKGRGKSKDSKGEKPQTTVCQDYVTDRGCLSRGDQCAFAHPRKPGKCHTCGGVNHDLSTCRRPPRDPKLNGPNSNAKAKGHLRCLRKEDINATACKFYTTPFWIEEQLTVSRHSHGFGVWNDASPAIFFSRHCVELLSSIGPVVPLTLPTLAGRTPSLQVHSENSAESLSRTLARTTQWKFELHALLPLPHCDNLGDIYGLLG